MLVRIMLAMALSCGVAHAGESIVSCDSSYHVDVVKPGMILVSGAGGSTARTKITHNVDGGSFSLDDKHVVLYGQPLKVHPKDAQATFLTLYNVGDGAKMALTRTYGSDIYSADFSADGKYLVVSSAYSIDVLDIANKKFESHDPAYTPPFSMGECNKK